MSNLLSEETLVSKNSMNPESGSCLVRCGGAAAKSLVICSFESSRHSTPPFHYVIRSIPLSDLLSSSSSVAVELRQVAHLGGDDLPFEGGCGVLGGSKIVFASGLKPNCDPSFSFGPLGSSDAYVFDTHDVGQGIVKMPVKMVGGKHKPVTAEFAGKLYVLSTLEFDTFVSFEVFDPQQGTWSHLPQFPNDERDYGYAIAGSKLFMSTFVPEGKENIYLHYYKQDPSVFSFDLAAAGPDAEWRKVPTMCNGRPLPFKGRGLVVDVPGQCNKRLLFSLKHDYRFWGNTLVVHLMSLDENQEDISELTEVIMPKDSLSEEQGGCHLLHLGGSNLCLVNSSIWQPDRRPRCAINYTVQGAVIPFQFEFDISNFDKDRKGCFTVQFQPAHIFEYHLRADATMDSHTLGCFLF